MRGSSAPPSLPDRSLLNCPRSKIRFSGKGRLMKLRATVFVPVVFPGEIFSDVDLDSFLDAEQVGDFAQLKLKPEFLETLALTRGNLENATASKIPCAPFNKVLARDLGPELREKFEVENFAGEIKDEWGSRTTSKFFEEPLATSLTGVKLEAIETFTVSAATVDESSFNFILFHLIANETETNLDAILSLTKLENQPIKDFLSFYYHTNFTQSQPQVERRDGKLPNRFDEGLLPKANGVQVKWGLDSRVSATFAVFSTATGSESSFVRNGHLFMQTLEDDRDITRFIAKSSFLGVLVNIQKITFDRFKGEWAKKYAVNVADQIRKRDVLNVIRNTWWWSRISYEDHIQIPYSLWVEKLGFERQLDSYQSEISDWWASYSAKKAESESEELARLNKLAKIFAVFGIVPAWVSLFSTTLPWWLALPLTLAIGLGLWKAPSRRIKRLIAKLESKLD